MASTIYIIYNARASLAGKVNYAYRKATSATPPCAACDLTYGGGLRLTETPQWSATKQRIVGVRVLQLHTDELPPEVVGFARANKVVYPVVLGRAGAGGDGGGEAGAGEAGAGGGEGGAEGRGGSEGGRGGGGEDAGSGGLQVLLTREDLAGLKGDHALFLKLLAERAAERGVVLRVSSGAATDGVGE